MVVFLSAMSSEGLYSSFGTFLSFCNRADAACLDSKIEHLILMAIQLPPSLPVNVLGPIKLIVGGEVVC